MPTTNLDQVSTELQSKLYVRYSKPEALHDRNPIHGAAVNREKYLDADTTTLRSFGNGPDQDVETIQDLDRDLWEAMYLKFRDFIIKNGHSNIPSHPDYEILKDWINRQTLNKPFLSESRFLKLDKLGFNWNIALSRDHAWDLMFSRLEDFQKRIGHCRVPYNWEDDKQLALWVMRQRKMNLQGKILDYRKQLLEQIRFTWSVQETYNTQWENYFRQLADFHQKFGHFNVPGKNIKLVSWMERQRLTKNKKLLPSDREQRLNEINFIWDFDEIKLKDWDAKYRQLVHFNKKHGHSFVPVKFKENKQLGNWVALQRKLQAQGKLSNTRMQKLDKLHFVWTSQTQSRLQLEYSSVWETNFQRLVEYKKSHGTCQVSLKIDPILQAWTVWQRKMFYEGRMLPARTARLNSISFPWSINEGYWAQRFDHLSLFYHRFGHTRVPSQWAENPRLGAWVYRIKLEKHKMDANKIALLDEMHFEWTIHHKKIEGWPAMYARLIEFKQNFGHCKVPVRWAEDPKLGKWVSRMRNEKQKLTKERLTLLQAADFHW